MTTSTDAAHGAAAHGAAAHGAAAPAAAIPTPAGPAAGENGGGPGDGTGTPPAKDTRGPLDPYLPARREALFLLGGGALGAALGGGTVWYRGREAAPEERDDEENLSGREARERLEAGNARYVAGLPLHPDQSLLRRTGLAKGQHPFAAVLCCADSRVPPEVVFDQGLGDLFVVRSAGQVVDRAVMGSLQYGVEHLETPLLVVLGHSQCGAVKATVEAVRTKGKPSGTDIDALVEAITPAVHEAEEIGADEESLVGVSIDINVERIVESLKEAPLIGEGARMRTVKVVGAVYDLKTGHVDWL